MENQSYTRRMPIKNKILLLLVVFMCGSAAAFSQYSWEFKSNDDGIVVYLSDVANSDFKAFRASTITPATSLSEITAILIDVENFDKLFPDIRESRIIKKNGDNHIIHYLINKAPWPVDDREGIFEQRAIHYQDLVMIDFKCIDYNFPLTEGVVRMTKGKGHWKISEIKKNLYEVTYQYHGEPSGKIPAWLANSVVVNHPVNTLNNLKKLIAGGKYQSAKVDFID